MVRFCSTNVRYFDDLPDDRSRYLATVESLRVQERGSCALPSAGVAGGTQGSFNLLLLVEVRQLSPDVRIE
jgi:hypothetical protein